MAFFVQMEKPGNIAVFTSGGDAPGMNASVRAVVRTAKYHGLNVYGIYRGFEGMIDNDYRELKSHSVSNIIQRGGTILKSARSDRFMSKEGREQAYKNCRERGINGVIGIGGDGTFTGLLKFAEETGMPVIGIPGTIDNDLYGTDLTLGYDTAINTVVEAIDKIRDTADAHERTFLVEVMGRDSGFIALDTGLSGGAEAILIPETDTDLEHIAEVLKGGWGRKKTSSIIVVAEGDEEGGAFKVAEKLKARVEGLKFRVTVLGHLQRGGSPTALDRVLGSRMGYAAVQYLMDGKTKLMTAYSCSRIKPIELNEAIYKNKNIDTELVTLAEILST